MIEEKNNQENMFLNKYVHSNGTFTMPFKQYSIDYNFYGDYRLRGDKI